MYITRRQDNQQVLFLSANPHAESQTFAMTMFYHKSISNICKRMNHTQLKRDHMQNVREQDLVTMWNRSLPCLRSYSFGRVSGKWILLNARQKHRPGCLRESLLTFSCSPRKDIEKRANVRCPAGLGRNRTCWFQKCYIFPVRWIKGFKPLI